MRRVMIGTAGHIDHGKSTLVQALTGVDPTRHPEERSRGMTIDIGFAPLFVEPELVVGMVDVPGHERFVRNMVAGATGIDLALFVVAADDGVMPQTREHLQILEVLGIGRGIVALTKADLVQGDDLDLAKEELRELLAGTFLADAPIFPVSAKTGQGLAELKEVLHAAVLAAPTKSPEGIFRLPVQRVFAVKGFGTVVTGIPFSGRVKVGDAVEAVPTGKTAHVRAIQAYGKEAKEAQAGHSVSLNLPELDHREVRRGDVIATPGYLHAVGSLEAKYRMVASAAGAVRTLRDLSSVRVLIGTAEAVGRIVLVGARELSPGEEAFVQLRLDEPIVAIPGDRFVLRLESPMVTLGGGTVVGISDQRLHRTKAGVEERLAAAEKAVADPKARVLVYLEGHRAPVEPQAAARASILDLGETRRHLAALEKEGAARPVGGGRRWISARIWTEQGSALHAAVKAFHKAHPAEVGVERAPLRDSLKIEPELFDALAADALKRGALQEAPGVRLAMSGHKAQLSGKAAGQVGSLEKLFQDAGFAPPGEEEALAKASLPGKEGKEAVKLLVQQGILVRVGEGILFHRDAVEKAKGLLLQTAEAEGQVESGKFRDLLATSRKYVIPLLEHFDKLGLTKRVGSQRFLRKYSK